MTSKAERQENNYQTTHSSQPLPLNDTTKKTSTFGICLIGLAVVVAGATVLMCITFHAYRPFSQNYHYLGLTVIALGGTVLTGFIVYKGILSIKQSKKDSIPVQKLEFNRDEELFILAVEGNKDSEGNNVRPAEALADALSKFAKFISAGTVTLETFNKAHERDRKLNKENSYFYSTNGADSHFLLNVCKDLDDDKLALSKKEAEAIPGALDCFCGIKSTIEKCTNLKSFFRLKTQGGTFVAQFQAYMEQAR